MKSLEEINLTPEQREILRKIRALVREMELINNRGCAHGLIALLGELSEGVLAPLYIREKLNIIFKYNPSWDYKYIGD